MALNSRPMNHAAVPRAKPMLSRQEASEQVAFAAHEAEAALQALGRALLAGAHTQIREAFSALKQRTADAEIGIETLIARVPALGPMLAMELYRRTHGKAAEDALATRPTNQIEPDEPGPEPSTSAAYLDCIGYHMA